MQKSNGELAHPLAHAPYSWRKFSCHVLLLLCVLMHKEVITRNLSCHVFRRDFLRRVLRVGCDGFEPNKAARLCTLKSVLDCSVVALSATCEAFSTYLVRW